MVASVNSVRSCDDLIAATSRLRLIGPLLRRRCRVIDVFDTADPALVTTRNGVPGTDG
jgi:hypothetical protein